MSLALSLAVLSFTPRARAQDALTVGNGVTCTTVYSGVTTVSIPVYIRDASGTPLGRDQAAGRKVQAFGFQVVPSPASAIARDGSGNMQITFSRAGLTATLSPLMESNPRSATAAGTVLQFDENSSPLLFTLNNPAPGDLVGTLTVTLVPGLPVGTNIVLMVNTDFRVTALSNQAGTIRELVNDQTLVVTDSCIQIATGGAAPVPASPAIPSPALQIGTGVQAALQTNGAADVVVTLLDPAPGDLPVEQRSPQIARLQDALLSTIPAGAVRLRHRFSTVPGFAGRLSLAGFRALVRNSAVRSIDLDFDIVPALCQSAITTHTDTLQVAPYNLTGNGVRVAVIDTGVSHSNPALAGTFLAEACTYNHLDPQQPPPCPAGRSCDGCIIPLCLSSNGSPCDSEADDVVGHGTMMAGVIASQGMCVPPLPEASARPVTPAPTSRGIAPAAQIVNVRIFNSRVQTGDSFQQGCNPLRQPGCTAEGKSSDLTAALDLINTNYDRLRVQFVSMSLNLVDVPDPTAEQRHILYSGDCSSQVPALAGAIHNLRTRGVTLFAATGNDGVKTAIGLPSCLPEVVAVGAIYAQAYPPQPQSGQWGPGFPACTDTTIADPRTTAPTVTCFSNSSAQVRLVAPGSWMNTPAALQYFRTGDTNYSDWSGTSFSSPFAAAVAALTWQAKRLTNFEMEDVLIAQARSFGARTATDGGFTFTSVDALAAVNAAQAQGIRGDANSDGAVTVGDVFYLINHLFVGGPGPRSVVRGNVNCNVSGTEVADIFYLINYLFVGGPTPDAGCPGS